MRICYPTGTEKVIEIMIMLNWTSLYYMLMAVVVMTPAGHSNKIFTYKQDFIDFLGHTLYGEEAIYGGEAIDYSERRSYDPDSFSGSFSPDSDAPRACYADRGESVPVKLVSTSSRSFLCVPVHVQVVRFFNRDLNGTHPCFPALIVFSYNSEMINLEIIAHNIESITIPHSCAKLYCTANKTQMLTVDGDPYQAGVQIQSIELLNDILGQCEISDLRIFRPVRTPKFQDSIYWHNIHQPELLVTSFLIESSQWYFFLRNAKSPNLLQNASNCGTLVHSEGITSVVDYKNKDFLVLCTEPGSALENLTNLGQDVDLNKILCPVCATENTISFMCYALRSLCASLVTFPARIQNLPAYLFCSAQIQHILVPISVKSIG